jgi:hypothetical protein
MRTAFDALTNPKPGDVIQISLGWTSTVLINDGEHVRFMATYNGMKNCGPYSVKTACWGPSLDDMATTEVLYVAE